MEKDIKIAQLIDTYYPMIDGPVNVITNYSKNLNKWTECKLLTAAAPKKAAYVDNQPFEVLRCKSGWAPENYRNALPKSDAKFKKRTDEENFDILHTHSPFGMGSFAIDYGRRHGVPVVATLHTKYYDDFSRVLKGNKTLCNYMLHRIMKVYSAADSVWTVNNAACSVLREYGYEGEIEVVRNGTDLKYPSNADELIKKVNDAHNLYGQKNVFIFVGRIAMYKNLELMARALKILKDAGEDFKMLIVGSGFDEAKFKAMTNELGLSDKFIFVGSVSDRQLLQGYYLRSDLFLFPSTFDTSSLVPIEAAAHKLPVLLIEGSCTAENIADGVNGFLAKETPEAFAQKIRDVIASPSVLRSVGEEALNSVYRSWEMVAAEALKKYKEIIASYNERRGK